VHLRRRHDHGTARVTGAVDVDVLESYLTARSPLPVPTLDRVTPGAPA